MSDQLDFTGERFLPGIAGEIAHEHWHRYAFARRFAAGRRVLDVACGEGYGSALLAEVASEVVGIDISGEAIAHANASYAGRPRLRFVRGSAAALPLPDRSVELVVSFETIEHLPRDLQPRMIAEVARVLTGDGVLVLSAPNPVEYSQARNYRNPFHLHEPSREELEALLAGAFPVRRWHRQRRYFGSALWSEAPGGETAAWTGDAAGVTDAVAPAAMYFLVVAARTSDTLSAPLPSLSLFSDRGEAELARVDASGAEVLRLDALLQEREAALDRQTGHVRHLEDLVAVRERVVVERDAQLSAATATIATERGAAAAAREESAKASASAKKAHQALTAESERLERALAAQERIIAYRQSARWWFALPWLRAKLLWQRIRG